MFKSLARLPPCLRCSTTAVAKTLHSSSTLQRNGSAPRRPPAGPPFRARAGSAPSRGKPSYGGKFGSFRSSPAAPSTITAEAVLVKLAYHLKTIWVRGDSTVQAIAVDLGVDRKRFKVLAVAYAKQATKQLEQAQQTGATSVDELGFDGERLRVAYITEGPKSVKDAALGAFVRWTVTQPPPSSAPSSFSYDPTLHKLQQLAMAADRRFVNESYPDARQQRRKIIMHVGPTNSGKTHSALVALSRARTGVYAGPLRLLAHEVFSRLNEGKIGDEEPRVCNLITGEEQRILDPEAGLSSCTIEMFPLAKKLNVGVIDEIQMIGDPGRGAAWTGAILGSNCEELHLCGEESVVELVQKMARELGDECIVKRYTRLSPLAVAERSLGGDLSKIRRGDCLVTFSRSNIFAFKRAIEEKTGLRVAVAYGGLPPEVREEQARVFNEGGYDVLVASDAVGMGLNLKIKRIVFESMHKWNGTAEIRLPTPQIKQIAGRAGRYGVHTSPTAVDDISEPAPSVNGEATTLDPDDLDILREAMAEPTVQVDQASLAASFDTAQDFEALLPTGTPFSTIFSLVEAVAVTTPYYRAVGHAGWGAISDKIQHITPLSFRERYLFGTAPVNLRDPKVVANLISFVESYAAGQPITMDVWSKESGVEAALAKVTQARRTKESASSPSSPRSSTSPGATIYSPEFLMDLESSHRCLTLYLWLSYRQSTIFCDREVARALRKDVEAGIAFVLEGMKFDRIERVKKRYKARMSGPGGQEDGSEMSRRAKGVFDSMGKLGKTQPYSAF